MAETTETPIDKQLHVVVLHFVGPPPADLSKPLLRNDVRLDPQDMTVLSRKVELRGVTTTTEQLKQDNFCIQTEAAKEP